MKKQEFISVAAFIAVVAVVWMGWSLLYPSGTWRYRMTVVVETPEGIKTGSAVREVHATCGPHLNPESSSTIEVAGEAVVVDLGKRGLLFMLVDGDYGETIPFTAFPLKGGGETTPEGIRYYSHLKDAKATLKPEQYPNFVRFRDVNDPKTIENVRIQDRIAEQIHQEDPKRPIVSFEDAFGKGVSIKEVFIEMTSDPVTWGIEKHLQWLRDIYGYLSGRHSSGPEWYERLDSGDFQRRHR